MDKRKTFSSKTIPTDISSDEKIPQGSYKDETVRSVVDIPRNHVKPVNARIFAVEQDPGEMKTAGGIILPTDYQAPEAKGAVTRRLRRYYVVDVADDCNLPIKRGDEVFPFIPQEAEEWKFPVIIDWYINRVYLVFHETELGGYASTDPVNIEVEE